MFFLYYRTSITGPLQVRSQKHTQNGGITKARFTVEREKGIGSFKGNRFF